MDKHIVTFVISATVNLNGVDGEEKISALVNVFRGYAQRMEGQLDLLCVSHEVKAVFLDSENQPHKIGFK